MLLLRDITNNNNVTSNIDVSNTQLASLNEKYKSLSLNKPKKIRRLYNKANSKFQYYDVQYLINRFPDI